MDRINGAVGLAARWLTLVMVLIGAYNAIARWASGQMGMSLSSNALNEMQWYLFSAVFLLGAAYGVREDVHVRVDILYGKVSARMRGWIDLLGSVLFMLPFSALMIWVSIPTVRNSWSIREMSPDPGGLPRYPIKALLIVSFILLFLQGTAQAIRAVRRIRNPESEPDPDGSPPHEATGVGAVVS